MKRSFWGWVLLCTLSTATLAFGQNANTSLRGTIKDPSDALVPGAKITLVDSSKGTTFTATAGTTGLYVFSQIPPAKYSITVSAPGFADQTKTAELLVNQPATIDFSLSVQSNATTIDVSASAQTLNTADASLGNSMGNNLIQAIPTETRNVPDLLSMQPGVLYLPPPSDGSAPDSRSGAVNGGRSDQGNVTIDGIDDNDQVNGTAFTGVLRQTQDSIEEFRVVTGGGNADAGRSSGAQVSMITKSGTNKIHGAAYEYHRPTFTVANDWFVKQAQVSSDQPNIPGKLIRNIFGADLGGPIKKDKLFLFMNYEGTRQAENAPVEQTAPLASYQAGILKYIDGGGNVVQLTSSDVAQLDSGCVVICNSTDYPNPPGPNPNALDYFNSMPTANGTGEGDQINTGSYTFSSHNPKNFDTYIARLDYTVSARHSIFVRGQLQKDAILSTEQFPGQGPSGSTIADNRGIIAGHTWSINSNLINDLRYGFVRQAGGTAGVGKGEYVDFRGMSTATSESRSSLTTTPVNNIVETLSWTKGSHSLSFGFNWRGISHSSVSDSNSYDSATTSATWFTGNAPEPADGPASHTDYKVAFGNLVGAIPERSNNYNYHVDSATSGSALASGTPVERHFKANEYEGYAQDAWRIKSNLTLTFGLRYTILQTPWETKGQEVLPTVDTHQWFVNRGKAASTGGVDQPLLSWAPGGKYYNKAGFFPMNKHDFAPRVAIAFAPSPRTSIRAGAGIFFDHYGEGMINTISSRASYGLSTSITNPASTYAIEGTCAVYDKTTCPAPAAPRFVGRNTLPNIDLGQAPPTTAAFPYTYPQTYAIKAGVDNHIKTPYSETFNLSIQHEFPGGFTFEGAYVGRLGRHLLQNLDLAEPTNYVDPQGGGDYFSNATKLSKLADSFGDGGANYHSVEAIPYFEDVFPWMKNFYGNGESATEAIFNAEWAWARYTYGETNAIYDLDLGYDGGPADWQPHFFQSQFSSFYTLSSIGSSYYNAGQFTLRHPVSHGLATDISYTWSKSIDMGSDSEHNSFYGGGNNLGAIYNSWNPGLNRGVSDFDTRHLITADYLYLMPFGRGKTFAGNANILTDALIGGWQLAGGLHWSSPLPFSLFDPGWNTNWELSSFTTVTDPSKTKVHRRYDAHGNPQYFDDDGNTISYGAQNGTPVRLSYPGEAGQRNHFRGDGYFDLDSGLSKNWNIKELGTLKFAWEVYNVTNSVRFDPQRIASQLTSAGLGIVSNPTLSQSRRMQFSLRFDF